MGALTDAGEQVCERLSEGVAVPSLPGELVRAGAGELEREVQRRALHHQLALRNKVSQQPVVPCMRQVSAHIIVFR